MGTKIMYRERKKRRHGVVMKKTGQQRGNEGKDGAKKERG